MKYSCMKSKPLQRIKNQERVGVSIGNICEISYLGLWSTMQKHIWYYWTNNHRLWRLLVQMPPHSQDIVSTIIVNTMSILGFFSPILGRPFWAAQYLVCCIDTYTCDKYVTRHYTTTTRNFFRIVYNHRLCGNPQRYQPESKKSKSSTG